MIKLGMYFCCGALVLTGLQVAKLALVGNSESDGTIQLLSLEDMKSIRGGACDNCHYDGFRYDECGHYTAFDPCLDDECIINFITESTCDPAQNQDCSTLYLPFSVYHWQFLKNYSSEDCSWTGDEYSWYAQRTHYYGPNCTTRTHIARCKMATNSCSGSDITTKAKYGSYTCL